MEEIEEKPGLVYLVYVRPVGTSIDGKLEYEFLFSETPETVWGPFWTVPCPSACGDVSPKRGTYSIVKRVTTNIPMLCAQQNSCFSMQDCTDRIIAVAHEDITGYDEYPEPYRLVFDYGEGYESVAEKLITRGAAISDSDIQDDAEDDNYDIEGFREYGDGDDGCLEDEDGEPSKDGTTIQVLNSGAPSA